MYQTLLTELTNHTFIVRINRPDKLNALNNTVIEELGAAVDEVYGNPEIKSLIITGTGQKAFVAGADISEFLSLSREQGTALARKGNLVFSKIENCPKPVVAAVNGFCLGGGSELAMACHFRLSSDNAVFGQPEVNLGLIPGYGGTQRLTQLIGKGMAMELIMTGRLIKAAEALRLGLVNEITTAENLLEKTGEILQTIHRKGPFAISRVIECVNAATTNGSTNLPAKNGFQMEELAFGACFATDDMKEGVAAFLAKRTPDFKGR